jgi:hypothetical protein
LAFSYWFDKPWFLTEGKLAAVLIIPSSWGSQLGGHLHQHRTVIKLFSGAVAGEKKKTSARGVSHAHLLLCLLFFFTLFLLASFYQKYKKISFLLVVIFTCFFLVLLEWVLMRTPSCVILLTLIIAILSTLLLRYLLLLQIFMRLNLLYCTLL